MTDLLDLEVQKKENLHLIMIPGFLSEQPSYSQWIKDYSHLVYQNDTSDQVQSKRLWDQLDPLSAFDARGWEEILKIFVIEHKLAMSVEVFNWPAQSIFSVLFDQIKNMRHQWASISSMQQLSKMILFNTANKIQKIWSEAYQAASDCSILLTEQCKYHISQGKKVYVIGHSLGGMMLLKSATQWQAHGIDLTQIKGSAWAPAITRKETDFSVLSTLNHPIEIVYSEHDKVLKHLFALGKLPPLSGIPLLDLPVILIALAQRDPQEMALGYLGSDPIYQAHDLNVSHLSLGHLDYLYYLPQLWSLSRVLPSI
jgi:hypothetical protein